MPTRAIVQQQCLLQNHKAWATDQSLRQSHGNPPHVDEARPFVILHQHQYRCLVEGLDLNSLLLKQAVWQTSNRRYRAPPQHHDLGHLRCRRNVHRALEIRLLLLLLQHLDRRQKLLRHLHLLLHLHQHIGAAGRLSPLDQRRKHVLVEKLYYRSLHNTNQKGV